MKATQIYDYIFLGTSVWYLQAVREGEPINGEGFLRYNLNSLIDDLNIYGLKVSRRAASDLEAFVDTLSREERELIDEDQARKIRSLSTVLRSTIDAESRGIIAYAISEKRYDSGRMISDPWSLFKDEAKDYLSDIAIYDIEEAAKCIVFERPTASAFHLMRAAESTLKDMYCSAVKRERVALMWGPMTSHLRKRNTKIDVALVDHLDNIRRNFRNPTQHPEKIYDLTEVQDLFGVCIDVINRMIPYLSKR